MAEEVKTVNVFCANEQVDVPHVVDISPMGEIILSCPCGRSLKFPAGTDADALKKYIISHKEANAGQVSQESVEAAKKELLDNL